jgi:hypothetical protein
MRGIVTEASRNVICLKRTPCKTDSTEWRVERERGLIEISHAHLQIEGVLRCHSWNRRAANVLNATCRRTENSV